MKIRISKDFRNLKEGEIFEFESETLMPICIVGENGCGKSTLFSCIRGKYEKESKYNLNVSDYIRDSNNIELIDCPYEKVFCFDSHKDNGLNMNLSFDAISFIESGGFHMNKLSHGQGELYAISKFIDKIKNQIVPNKTLILLDEFDKGFSLKHSNLANNLIMNLTLQYKCKVMYITHNPFLIIDSLCCYHFEKKESYINTFEYIKNLTGYEIKKAS